MSLLSQAQGRSPRHAALTGLAQTTETFSPAALNRVKKNSPLKITTGSPSCNLQQHLFIIMPICKCFFKIKQHMLLRETKSECTLIGLGRTHVGKDTHFEKHFLKCLNSKAFSFSLDLATEGLTAKFKKKTLQNNLPHSVHKPIFCREVLKREFFKWIDFWIVFYILYHTFSSRSPLGLTHSCTIFVIQ